MPLSSDNQDFGKSDEKNREEKNLTAENTVTTDDLKGKKVDADPADKKDEPSQQTS